MSASGVRKILELGPAGFEDLAAELDIPKADRRGRGLLRGTLRDLTTSGIVALWAGEDGEPRYRLTSQPGAKGGVQTRLERAARSMAAGFTIHDLVFLSGAARDYAQRWLRFQREEGLLIPVGRKAVRKYGKAVVYRLAPGKEKVPFPRYSRRAQEKKQQSAASRQPPAKERVAAVMAEVRGVVEQARSRVLHAWGHSFAEAVAEIDRAIEKALTLPMEILDEMDADLQGVLEKLEGADYEPEGGHEAQ